MMNILRNLLAAAVFSWAMPALAANQIDNPGFE